MFKKHTYGPCKIWSLFTLGKWKIELVWAPKYYTIPEHSHNNQDIELIVLWGNWVYLERLKKNRVASNFHITSMPSSIFKRFTINAGDYHWFKTTYSSFLFLNIEHWKIEPTSAAIDLQLKEVKYAQT